MSTVADDYDFDGAIEDTPKITSLSRAGLVWHGRPDAESWGECGTCGETFDGKDAFDRHQREHHPFQCAEWGCDRAARYKDQGQPHSYCPRHADEHVDATFSVIRVNEDAAIDLPRLPAEHPLEVVIRGLETTDE